MKTPPEDRKSRLLHAAQALFAERPFDAVSMADIADRAGVAFGLVAHHFGSKRGVYLAALSAMADDLRAARDRPLDDGDLATSLRQAIARHIAYLQEREPGFRAVMRGGIGADPEARQIVEALRWEGAQQLLQKLGVNTPMRPALHAAMHGWVGYLDESVLAWLDDPKLPRKHLAELAVSALIASLKTVACIDAACGIKADLLARLEDG